MSDDSKNGKKVFFSSGGEGHPQGLESGIAEFLVKLVQGDFEDINKIIFLNEVPLGGVLRGWEKTASGWFEIEIEFDLMFMNGLEYSIQNYIMNGGAALGFSEVEHNELDQLSEQKKLIGYLAECVIPSRKDDIVELAKPSLLLYPYEASDAEKPHFFGSSKVASNIHLQIPLDFDLTAWLALQTH